MVPEEWEPPWKETSPLPGGPLSKSSAGRWRGSASAWWWEGASGECGFLMGSPVGSKRWEEEIVRVRKGEREGAGGMGHRATGQGTVSVRIRRWGALDYKVVFVWGGVQVRQSNLIGFHPSCSVLQVTKLDEGEAPALTWRQHSDTDAVG